MYNIILYIYHAVSVVVRNSYAIHVDYTISENVT